MPLRARILTHISYIRHAQLLLSAQAGRRFTPQVLRDLFQASPPQLQAAAAAAVMSPFKTAAAAGTDVGPAASTRSKAGSSSRGRGSAAAGGAAKGSEALPVVAVAPVTCTPAAASKLSNKGKVPASRAPEEQENSTDEEYLPGSKQHKQQQQRQQHKPCKGPRTIYVVGGQGDTCGDGTCSIILEEDEGLKDLKEKIEDWFGEIEGVRLHNLMILDANNADLKMATSSNLVDGTRVRCTYHLSNKRRKHVAFWCDVSELDDPVAEAYSRGLHIPVKYEAAVRAKGTWEGLLVPHYCWTTAEDGTQERCKLLLPPRE